MLFPKRFMDQGVTLTLQKTENSEIKLLKESENHGGKTIVFKTKDEINTVTAVSFDRNGEGRGGYGGELDVPQASKGRYANAHRMT